MSESNYCVYIMSSANGTLYIGITHDLLRRIEEHKSQKSKGFTQKYHINRLVYYEQTTDVSAAIAREKELKGSRRSKKLDLIRSINPEFLDLYDEFVMDPKNWTARKGVGKLERRKCPE